MIDSFKEEQPVILPQTEVGVDAIENVILSENSEKVCEKHENLSKNHDFSCENDVFSENLDLLSTETNGSENLNSGSSYGKFKDAKSLLDAYNNLQAEFTRRSQRLNQLEKELEAKTSSAEVVAPAYESDGENWYKVVAEFVEKNPIAKTYATEISEEIINDRSMTIERAYEKVLARHFVEPSSLADNLEFLDRYIYSNEKIKGKILQEFFDSLQNNPVPKLMGLNRGEINMSKTSQPTTILDAGRLALDMLRNK